MSLDVYRIHLLEKYTGIIPGKYYNHSYLESSESLLTSKQELRSPERLPRGQEVGGSSPAR